MLGRRKHIPADPVQFSVAFTVLRRPGVYLGELQKEIAEEYGEELSLSAICRFFHKNGFTRQKLKIAAKQRDPLLRSQFVLDVSLYTPEMLNSLMKLEVIGVIAFEGMDTVCVENL